MNDFDLGTLRILLVNNTLITLPGCTRDEGEEWTDWLESESYEFPDVDYTHSVMSMDRDKILAMEWTEDGAEDMSLLYEGDTDD